MRPYQFFAAPSLFILSLALQACGGGSSGGLASAPPPIPVPPPTTAPSPTPTPTSSSHLVVYQTAEYQPLVVEHNQANGTTGTLEPGTVTISVNSADKSYTITTLDPTIPSSPVTFFPANNSQPFFPDQDVVQTAFEGGTATDRFWLWFKPGLQYTALGEWAHSEQTRDDPDNASNYRVTYMAFGQRTPAADLPTTGTATYTSQLFNLYEDGFGRVTLVANFGTSNIDADVGFSGSGGGLYYLTAKGSGPIDSQGTFGIDLSGSASVTPYNDEPDFTDKVTGTLIGAFFGPNAEETAGVLNVHLDTLNADVMAAFAAAQLSR